MQQKDLTVLTLNTFGVPFRPNKMLRTFMRNSVRERYRQIVKEITPVDPDILCFQEVTDYPHALFLKSILSQYPHAVFKPMLYGPRGGLMTFSKLPIENYTFEDFLVKGNVFDKSITGLLTQRGILSVRLKDYPVRIINTHITQNSDHDWSPTNRYIPLQLSQLSQLVHTVKEFAAHEEKIILAGDLNIPKASELYSSFIKDLPLQDVFSEDNFPTYHELFLPKNVTVGRIDYLFSQLPVRKKGYLFREPVIDKRGKELYLSDHIGLLATISI